MIKSSCPHLFLLAIAFILLLLFTIVNCNNNNNNNNEMETTLFENQLTPTDHLYDLLEQDNLNNDDIKIYIRNLLKSYPDRRATFHALRGKRRVILP